MINPNVLEESYHEFFGNLSKWAPDGVLQVDLKLLDELGLLSNAQIEQSASDNLTHYFHIIETPDKVTLFNEQFAIWSSCSPHQGSIIPQNTFLKSCSTSSQKYKTLKQLSLQWAKNNRGNCNS